MAKQQPDDAQKKTQLSKKSSQPTQLAKKSPQPTMLAPDDPKGPDTPPKPPKLSLDDDEIVEAEAVDSGVVEAQPASDVVEVQPVSDVAEAEPVSDVAEAMMIDSAATKAADDDADIFAAEEVEAEQRVAAQSAPETPVKAEHADEVVEALSMEEDVIGNEPSKVESSVRVQGRKRPSLEETEMLEAAESPAAEIEQTIAFEGVADDDGSAVDLGRKLSGKSGSGIDEVAEELESGVKLEAVESPPPRRKPEPSVEFDDLMTEEGDLPEGPPSVKKRMSKEDATDPDMLVRNDELPTEELGGKSVEDAAADLWSEPEEAAPASTPASGKKKSAVEPAAQDESEALTEEAAIPSPVEADTLAAASDEAPAPKAARPKRPGGGTAVMQRPMRKPKYGRRWLGGMFLGLILAAGALVGIRYYDPDILDPVYEFLPEAKQPKAVADLKKAKADADLVRGQLAQASDEKAELEKGLEAKNEEIKKLGDEVKSLAVSKDAATAVRDVLLKNMLIDAKADAKELAKAVGQTIAAKEAKEKLVDDIEKALAKAKLLADDDKLDVAAVDKIAKEVGEKQAALAAVNKLLEGAMIKDAGAKGVEQLVTAKKDLDDKLAEVNKVLTAEKIKTEGAAGLKEVVTLRNQLQKDRDELDKAIKDAYKELADGQLAPAKGDPRQQLLAGAKTARQRAESPLAIPLTQLAAKLGSLSLNPGADAKAAFDAAALLSELNYYRLREPLIQSPEQKLDTYLAVYQDRNRKNAAEQAAALKDAAWVLSPGAKASPAAQGKAHAVRGLVLRNQEKYGEARQALTAAVAAPQAGAWLAQAKQALQELTDPAAFYLPRVDQLQSGGQIKSAQQELDSALKALPNDARLLAQRGLLRIEEARGGKMSAEVQAAIRQDAEAAAKNPKTAADGAFVLGLLEEELGNYAQAEQLLRQALKSHQGPAEEAARIRIALARVLQRDRAPVAAPPPAKKEEKKAADATGASEVSQAFPLAAALLVGQAVPDDDENPAAVARLTESIKLAKELIDSTNPKIKGQGHMLLGQALAKQGKRTEGVREYLKGLEMLFPGMASKEMGKLLEEHPAFQQPDAAKTQSAYLAEVQFGKGLHYYWTKQYPEAESHFKQAAGFFSHDARYQYYLGLAQLAQKTKVKRDAAYYSFEQGAKLEADNRPSVSEINASLERVQGDLRKLINSFRTKAIEYRN